MADEPAKPTATIYKLTRSGSNVQKDLGPNGGSNPGNAVQPNAFEAEDEYQQLYVGATRDQGIIQPPYMLRTLDRLSLENNALGPCIEAMVTNVDGTGYVFEAEDQQTEDAGDDVKVGELDDFFREPWPGVSFGSMRKVVRRDLERTGNGYLEVLRNAQDEIAFFRRVDSKMMRLLRLDDAVPVKQMVLRKGVAVGINVMTRERRYCQLVNGVSLMYFKEFGSQRDLHKKTAAWAKPGERLPANMRATEIIHFTVLPDSHTPYGVPRWINQIPSVLGSRKAEEFNLEFFENGGIPPVIILLQDGTLQAETRQALESMTTGDAARNNRVQILEVVGTGGNVDTAPNARVTVERFGAERTNDSMFEKYDQRCEERVRRSFRMPPIFVGQSKDYNFACYDEQTETLTDHGWIRHDQYALGMKIACYDRAAKALVYHEPEGGLLAYAVEGVEMHRFAGQNLDMLVTPKHRMSYTTPGGDERLETVEQMLASCTRPRFTARIDNYDGGSELGAFAVPWVPLRGGSNCPRDHAPRQMPAEDFLEFVAWYVSEGCPLPQGSAVSICQKATKHWPRIEALLKRFELNGYNVWWFTENAATGMRNAALADKSMYHWLRANVGLKQHERRVPKLVMGLRKAQLRIFFDTLMAGDGTWDARTSRASGAYCTTSKALADDLQSIAIMLGYRAKLRETPPGTAGIRPCYRVLLTKGSRAGGDGRLQTVRPCHYGRETYSGVVYCFSVPTGVFVTRRNGVVAVQGNTAFASYVVTEAQVFKPERDHFDEVITMRVLSAMGYIGYKMRSKPLVIEDATLKLQGVEIAMGLQQIEPADVIDAINEIVGTHLKVSDDATTLADQLNPQMPGGATHTLDAAGNLTPINPTPVDPARGGARPPSAPGKNGQNPGKLPKPITPALIGGKQAAQAPGGASPVGSTPVSKAEAPTTALELAHRTMLAMRKRDFVDLAFNLSIIGSLDEAGRNAFNDVATELAFVDSSLDPSGLAELSACTMAVMAGQPHSHNHGS
jgi:PBSX family phage portal protein